MSEQQEERWIFQLREHADPLLGYYEIVILEAPDDTTEPWGTPMVPESRVQELEGELAAAEDREELAKHDGVLAQTELEAAESHLARLEEALRDLISLNDEMVQRGVEANRVDAATAKARSLLTGDEDDRS